MRKDKKKEIEELSIKKIRSKMFWDAIQHPLTLLPLATAVIAAAHLGFIAPFTGGGLVSLPIAIAAGGASLLSFGYSYLIRGRGYIEEKGRELAEMRDQMTKDQQEAERRSLSRRVSEEFVLLGFSDGSRELGQLDHEYKELIELLGRSQSSMLLNLDRVKELADEIYLKGLDALLKVGESVRLVRDSNHRELQKEVESLEREIKSIADDPEKTWMADIKKKRLEVTQGRLSKVKAHEQAIQKLLMVSDQCEARLHHTAMDVTSLSVESSGEEANAVIVRLEDVIYMANRVNEELKRFDDEVYSPITED